MLTDIASIVSADLTEILKVDDWMASGRYLFRYYLVICAGKVEQIGKHRE